MKTSWGMKGPHRRKPAALRTKVRWEKLGLEDPSQSSSALSIDDIRRQITSAASQGLSPDTISRSHPKPGQPKTGAKTLVATRKRSPSAS